MADFPTVSFAVSAVAFTALATVLGLNSRRPGVMAALAAAALINAAWLGLSSFYVSGLLPFGIGVLKAAEVVRDGAWVALMLRLVSGEGRFASMGGALWCAAGLYLIGAGVLAFLAVTGGGGVGVAPGGLPLEFIAFLCIAVLGLAVVEQIYRNTHRDHRWAIKYLCFAVALMFGFDFYLYADAVLFKRLSADAWYARGAVNVLAVPLLVLATKRNPNWDVRLFVSRQVMFHSTVFVAAGGYLLAMAAAGYYFRTMGGTWGGAIAVVFVSAGLLGLVLLALSAQVRAEVRHFLARHFYQNKYDYAEQWLSFTEQMTHADNCPESLADTIVHTVADIVDSTGGVLFESVGDRFERLAAWNLGDESLVRLTVSPAARAELERERLVRLDTPGAERPPELAGVRRAWVLVPMLHGRELVGVMVLGEPRAHIDLGDEDRALLVTVGRQAAGMLVLVRANEKLAEARQFDAFNRLSAFVVHDVKNVVAQLALIEQNAARFRDNPEFVDDAFNTVSSAVARMNRLLDGLRKSHLKAASPGEFAVAEAIEGAVARCRHRLPAPELQARLDGVALEGDGERFAAVLEHLIANAQEATPDDGQVRVEAMAEAGELRIAVIDTGTGMSEAFIARRLFKPFDTTKGNAGMGVGVFEAKTVVEALGGRIEVTSREGEGTRFDIVLPGAGDGNKNEREAPKSLTAAAPKESAA